MDPKDYLCHLVAHYILCDINYVMCSWFCLHDTLTRV